MASRPIPLLALVLVTAACGASHHSHVRLSYALSSPDGGHVAWVRFVGKVNHGYLQVLDASTRKVRTLYDSDDSCCDNLVWVSPTLLAFDDDYRAKTVSLATGRVRQFAQFSTFAVSRDGTLALGYDDHSVIEPTVWVVAPIHGGTCRLVTPDGQDDQAASFAAPGTVTVKRMTWDATTSLDTGPARELTLRISSLPVAPRCP